jgi:hypothetical protein
LGRELRANVLERLLGAHREASLCMCLL